MGSEVDIPDATAVLGSWLHVGSEESVAEERKDDLVSAGVTHVLSVMKRPPPWLLDPRNHPLPFTHMRVKVEDTRAADISEHFETTGAFIRACEASGGRCIVHCAFGQSRSVSVTAAYLMTERHMSLGAALEAIRSRRPHACPNPSFMTQLVRHEMATTGGAPSDLRAFPSLPNTWRFIRWNDPRRQSTEFVSCHGRLMEVTRVSRYPRLYLIRDFMSKEEAKVIIDVAAPELHPSLVVKHSSSGSADGKFIFIFVWAIRMTMCFVCRERRRDAFGGSHLAQLPRAFLAPGGARRDPKSFVPHRARTLARGTRAGGALPTGPAVPSPPRLVSFS